MDGATKGIEVTAIDLAERFVGISEVTWTAFNPKILAMLTASIPVTAEPRTWGGADANHAVSPSGVREKNMTLDFAKLVKDELQAAEPDITVILTRTGDTNLTLEKRANFARDNRADLFLSIHFNGFNGVARGVEAWVRSQADGNVNHEDDKSFADRIQKAVFAAIKARDPNTRDRGVKDMN